jgi:hypothetical protein
MNSIFNWLSKHEDTKPLRHEEKLQKARQPERRKEKQRGDWLSGLQAPRCLNALVINTELYDNVALGQTDHSVSSTIVDPER